jgi:hypothetical protein
MQILFRFFKTKTITNKKVGKKYGMLWTKLNVYRKKRNSRQRNASLKLVGITQLLPTNNSEVKTDAPTHNSGPCGSNNWAPNSWTNPSTSNVTDATLDVTQYFMWDSTHLQNFFNLGDGPRYQHEMRRDANVWNFIRLGFGGLYCFLENATNLPNLDPWWSEESDWWAINCPKGYWPDDEEAQTNAVDSGSLQANTWYYCVYRFERLQRGTAFNLQTESEYCKGLYPICASGFDWCYHTTGNILFVR